MDHLEPAGERGHEEVPVPVDGDVVKAEIRVDVMHLLETLLRDVPEDIDAPGEGTRYVDQAVLALHQTIGVAETLCHLPASLLSAHSHIAIREVGTKTILLILIDNQSVSGHMCLW